MFLETSATRATARMDMPSQSMARTWARLSFGSLFMGRTILNHPPHVKH